MYKDVSKDPRMNYDIPEWIVRHALSILRHDTIGFRDRDNGTMNIRSIVTVPCTYLYRRKYKASREQ